MIKSVSASTLMSSVRRVSFLDKSRQIFEFFVLESLYNVLNRAQLLSMDSFRLIWCYLAMRYPGSEILSPEVL